MHIVSEWASCFILHLFARAPLDLLEKYINMLVILIIFRMLADDNIEDEDGDFRSKDDRDHRYISEQEKMRVSWNLERRSFLDQSATKL